MQLKKHHFITIIGLLWITLTQAQFTLDGEFKPRTEYRNGFGSILTKDADAGFGIATRLRLNAGYQLESYQFYVSLQDVMVWGENRQLNPEDSNNSFAIFQAWANIKLGEGFTTKVGRQMLIYDDQRILGGVDWAMQARNHDAALLKYNKNNFMMDLGLAFNQDFNNTTINPGGFQSVGTTYNTTGYFSYKTMQYLYLKQKWNTFSASALVMNNGFQNFEATTQAADGVSNLLTLGTHLNYTKNSFNVAFNGYLQSGERQNQLAVSNAYLLGLDLGYKISKGVSLGMGTEITSGDKSHTDKTEAFFPLYGTNHKFNGFMDYFYVGNHANSIGLIDIHASAKFTLGTKSDLWIKILKFNGEQALASGEKSLGTELDFVYSQNFKGYHLSIGYSQMFANDGMYELKGTPKVTAANVQNWAWVQLTIKPKFLNTASTN